MDPYGDLFDAVEYTWFYTRRTGWFNRRAEDWARAHRVPVVGNADVHRLSQLGRTYSLIDAERTPASICEAVRAGRVTFVTEPLGAGEAASYAASLLGAGLRKSWQTLTGRPVQPAGAEEG